SFSPLSFLYGETSQTLVAKISPTSYQISFDPFPFCYNILRFSEKSASSQRSMAVYVDQTQQIVLRSASLHLFDESRAAESVLRLRN
ncbi:hypothetical protein LINPERHAP1_LOCUS22708, partial [Linum perenne]